MKKGFMILIILMMLGTSVNLFGIIIPEEKLPCYEADVNCDGTVNIIDCLMIAQYSVDMLDDLCNMEAADLNDDGVVDMVDALILSNCFYFLTSP